MKCLFCQGSLIYTKSLPHTGQPGLYCISCSKSDDIWYEIYVMLEQIKPHCNWHTYGSSADYKYRKRWGLPLVGKKGRKNKWA